MKVMLIIPDSYTNNRYKKGLFVATSEEDWSYIGSFKSQIGDGIARSIPLRKEDLLPLNQVRI